MSFKSQEFVENIRRIVDAFNIEYNDFIEKEKKASGKRARKIITGLKKQVTPLRKALGEDINSLGASKNQQASPQTPETPQA